MDARSHGAPTRQGAPPSVRLHKQGPKETATQTSQGAGWGAGTERGQPLSREIRLWGPTPLGPWCLLCTSRPLSDTKEGHAPRAAPIRHAWTSQSQPWNQSCARPAPDPSWSLWRPRLTDVSCLTAAGRASKMPPRLLPPSWGTCGFPRRKVRAGLAGGVRSPWVGGTESGTASPCRQPLGATLDSPAVRLPLPGVSASCQRAQGAGRSASCLARGTGAPLTALRLASP